MTQWPRPRNVTKVRSFLGLAGYYREFVRDFSQVAAPLTILTKKITKYEWAEKCEEALLELNKRLTRASLLALLGEGEHFVVYSDTSRGGVRLVF